MPKKLSVEEKLARIEAQRQAILAQAAAVQPVVSAPVSGIESLEVPTKTVRRAVPEFRDQLSRSIYWALAKCSAGDQVLIASESTDKKSGKAYWWIANATILGERDGRIYHEKTSMRCKGPSWGTPLSKVAAIFRKDGRIFHNSEGEFAAGKGFSKEKLAELVAKYRA